MGTKKMSAVFRNSCFSQSGVIVDAKVSDRQRRCCAPCRNIIGYKSSFTCNVLLVFAFCLVGCNTRWDLSLSDNDSALFGTCNQVQLLIYVSSVFPQSGFRLHSSFAEIFSRTEVSGIYCCVKHCYGSKVREDKADREGIPHTHPIP